jgi:NADH:ubiquinone oxidoreductase subunit 5 (subunit L)/multisubunit Na+/H+ antiporter MnhA subunit
MGALTALVSSSIANVQPTVKTQIAYSSIAQIGIMFIEVALGLEVLALVHFAGNALLRSYQLLVSPSVLNYLIHDQYYHFEKPEDKSPHGFMGRLRSSLYVLSIKEYNLDRFQFHVLWTPFKWLGRRVAFLATKPGYVLLGVLGAIGLAGLFLGANTWPGWHKFFAFSFAFLAFLLVSSAFTERASARRAWLFIIVAHVSINLAISYNIAFDGFAAAIYLSGVVLAGMTGWYVLSEVERRENTYDLCNFYGHIYEYPRLGLVFLLSALALVGFPITPTFIGLDVVLSQVHSNQIALLIVVALCFVFMEIAVLRLYARVFLGQHVKAYHSVAFKNS